MSAEIEALKATAQSIVTLILHDDRKGAAALVEECIYPDGLALVLADLVTYVHRSWCHVAARALDTPPPSELDIVDQWQHILLNVEARTT